MIVNYKTYGVETTMEYNTEIRELLMKEEDFIISNEYEFLKTFIENISEPHMWHITDISFSATMVIVSASFRFNRPVVFRIPAGLYVEWKKSKLKG